MVFDFEEEFMISELEKIKPKRVLVQLPEGIKTKAFEIQKQIERLNIEVVFSGETAWGGCCLAIEEAKNVDADLIIHFGHAEFMKVDFPVLYIEIKDILNLEPILQKSLDSLKNFKKIGLSVSVQHRHDLEKILKFYKENNKEIILSKKEGFAFYEGQVIGCEYRGLKKIENDIDVFVIVGNRFHSIGASLSLNKPVILIDVYNNEVSEMSKSKEKVIRERVISIDKFRQAKKIGIIVENKIGQKFGNYKNIIDKFKKEKEVILIAMNEMSPDKIMNFYSVDAFVELACPRIAIDDFSKYPKPIITYRESLVALGELSWEKFLEEGIL